MGITVNVSGREVVDHSLVERVARNLEAISLLSDRLTLEVTDSEVIADLAQAAQATLPSPY